MIEQMSFLFNFGDVFVSIPLDTSDIETKKDSNIDESENFNINIQIYLTSKEKYKEFTIIKVNLNIIRNNSEEHLYNKDNFYLEPNNVEYNDII